VGIDYYSYYHNVIIAVSRDGKCPILPIPVCADSRIWQSEVKSSLLRVCAAMIVEPVTGEFSATVITLMCMPAALFGLICAICIVRNVAHFIAKCYNKS